VFQCIVESAAEIKTLRQLQPPHLFVIQLLPLLLRQRKLYWKRAVPFDVMLEDQTWAASCGRIASGEVNRSAVYGLIERSMSGFCCLCELIKSYDIALSNERLTSLVRHGRRARGAASSQTVVRESFVGATKFNPRENMKTTRRR